jgi:hypothetical protein
VQAYPSVTMVTNGPGTDRCGPWILQRAIRNVRDDIDHLPERFSFHDLPHYLASLLIASSADVKTVQARMRHASARTTLDTYSHLWPDADESTRTAVGAVVADRLRETPAAPLRPPCGPGAPMRSCAAGQRVSRLTRRSRARTRTGAAGSEPAGSRSRA